MNIAIVVAILIGLLIIWAIASAQQRKRHMRRLTILREKVETADRQTADERAKKAMRTQADVQQRMSRRHA